MSKICKVCKVSFKVWKYEFKKRKYCSMKCRDNDPEFIKKISEGKMGNKNPMKRKEVQLKASRGWFTTERVSGEKNNHWKGNNVKYNGLHEWVRRNINKTKKCEWCNFESDNPHMIHLANLSREYKRNLDDWLILCAGCHKQYDL